jgi:hypothetical protein
LLQLWMRTDVRVLCRSHSEPEPNAQTMKPSPPPAHPFSQHGIDLSNIPQRRSAASATPPSPVFQGGGPEKAENSVRNRKLRTADRTGIADPTACFRFPFLRRRAAS